MIANPGGSCEGRRFLGRRVPARVFEADRRVREMAALSEERARAVLAAAEASAAEVLAAAREAGRREGLSLAASTLAAAAAERDRILAAVDGEVAALALDVARKVLGRHVEAFPAAVVDLVARGLAGARGRREVLVRVHPEDAAAVRAAEGDLARALARSPLGIREDPSVPRGGAVVETEAGRIDAGIEAQLREIARTMAEAAA